MEDGPKNIQQSMSSLDVDLWLEAIHKKMDILESNKTCNLIDLPLVCKPIGYK